MDTNSDNHTHKNFVPIDKKQVLAHSQRHAWEYQNKGKKSKTLGKEKEQAQKTPIIFWGLSHS